MSCSTCSLPLFPSLYLSLLSIFLATPFFKLYSSVSHHQPSLPPLTSLRWFIAQWFFSKLLENYRKEITEQSSAKSSDFIDSKSNDDFDLFSHNDANLQSNCVDTSCENPKNVIINSALDQIPVKRVKLNYKQI